MMKSLLTGSTGLKSHQFRMNVIGNNIANINTIGFKAGRASFSEMMASTLQGARRPESGIGGVNPIQLGGGVAVGGVDNIFTQGSLEFTGVTTDLATIGTGFLIVSDGSSNFYTRTSGFLFDANGQLVDAASGMVLQGVMANADGVLGGSSIEDISIPMDLTDPANATTRVTYGGNLDASESPLGTILDSSSLLALADSDDSLSALRDSYGSALGLTSGDSLKVSCSATGTTETDELYNTSGVSFSLNAGDEFTVSATKVEMDSTAVPGDVDNAFSFSLTVGGTAYTVNVSKTDTGDGAEYDKVEVVDSIRADIINSGAPVVVENNMDGSFTITAIDQTTDVIVNGTQGELDQVGLLNGQAITADYDTVTIGQGDTFSDFLADIEAALDLTGSGSAFTVAQNSDGSFTITHGTGTADASIEIRASSPANSLFATAISELQGELEVGDTSDDTDRFTVQSEIVFGTDFEDLEELAESITDSLGKASGAFAATYSESTGKLSYLNGTGGSDLYDISITTSPTNQSFETALSLSDEDITADDSSLDSTYFLRTAESDDNLIELYTDSGDWMEMTLGDELAIDAQVGGAPVLTMSTIIGTDISTYGELAEKVEEALGLDEGTGVSIDSDGSLKVNGTPGEANAVSELSISSSGNTVLASGFNFSELQEAADVTKSVSAIVYDSLGDNHSVTLTFKKSEIPNRWTWTADTGGDEVITGGSSGTILFNEDGSLAAFSISDGAPLSFEPGNGAAAMEIDLFAGTADSRDGITQFASTSSVQSTSQDGWGEGTLSTIGIDSAGIISGQFTNGITRNLAQIHVAEFNNPGGLEKASDNLYTASPNSGDPKVGAAGPAGGTAVSSGYLEMSNVDLSSEFTSMIMTQRGFQANARIITTSDEMLVDTVSLKR